MGRDVITVIITTADIKEAAETVSKMANTVFDQDVYLIFDGQTLNMTVLTVDEAVQLYKEKAGVGSKT